MTEDDDRVKDRARERMILAHQVMLYHVAADKGECEVCPEKYPCWARRLAEIVIGDPDEEQELVRILTRRNLMTGVDEE